MDAISLTKIEIPEFTDDIPEEVLDSQVLEYEDMVKGGYINEASDAYEDTDPSDEKGQIIDIPLWGKDEENEADIISFNAKSLPCSMDSSSWHWRDMDACIAWILAWHYKEELEYYNKYPENIESAARVYKFAHTLISLNDGLLNAGAGTAELIMAYMFYGIKNDIKNFAEVIRLMNEKYGIIFVSDQGEGLPYKWFLKAKAVSEDIDEVQNDLQDAVSKLYETLDDMGFNESEMTFEPFSFPKSDKSWEQEKNDDELNIISAVLLCVVDDPGLYGNGIKGAVEMLQNKEFFDELCMYNEPHPAAFFSKQLKVFFDEELEPVRQAAIRHLLPFL